MFCEHSGNTDSCLNKRITERRELEGSACEEVKRVWNGWERPGPRNPRGRGGAAHGVALARAVGPTGVGHSSPRDTTRGSEQPERATSRGRRRQILNTLKILKQTPRPRPPRAPLGSCSPCSVANILIINIPPNSAPGRWVNVEWRQARSKLTGETREREGDRDSEKGEKRGRSALRLDPRALPQ